MASGVSMDRSCKLAAIEAAKLAEAKGQVAVHPAASPGIEMIASAAKHAARNHDLIDIDPTFSASAQGGLGKGSILRPKKKPSPRLSGRGRLQRNAVQSSKSAVRGIELTLNSRGWRTLLSPG